MRSADIGLGEAFMESFGGRDKGITAEYGEMDGT